MALKLIETGKLTPEEHERSRQDQADFDWLVEHAQEIEEQYPGKYFAIVNQELFVGDTYEETEQKAKSKYPNRDPFIEYTPWTKKVLVI